MSQTELVTGELDYLAHLWDGPLRQVFEAYRERAGESLALAAALVEVGCELQRLGGPAASPADLLLGDLCLARASRLLAELKDQQRQISFARVVETVSSSAAASVPAPSVRSLLLAAIGDQ